MKITILCIGKTTLPYLRQGIDLFLERLKHQTKINYIELPDVKNATSLPIPELKRKEAESFLKHCSDSDTVILLDESGKTFSSVEFSSFLEKQNSLNLIFIIGGAYGFDESITRRANHKISLSRMTFTHQMVRLIFVEQVYRALSILKGLPYHHC